MQRALDRAEPVFANSSSSVERLTFSPRPVKPEADDGSPAPCAPRSPAFRLPQPHGPGARERSAATPTRRAHAGRPPTAGDGSGPLFFRIQARIGARDGTLAGNTDVTDRQLTAADISAGRSSPTSSSR